MLLGFQERFAPAVELGLNHRTAAGGAWAKDEHGNDVWNGLRPKRQTIRAPRKDGKVAKVGDTLYLYTGLRTKKCRKLGEAKCMGSWKVSISRDGVLIDNNLFVDHEADEFARDDGFKDFAELRAWIDKTHGPEVFVGQVYRW